MPPCRRGSPAQRSRPLDYCFQACRPIETERHVEALDSLTRSALDQVIESGRYDRLLPLRGDVHQAQVRVAGELGRGTLAQHFGERLAVVELLVRRLQVGKRPLEVEVAGGEYSARHRHEVWDERDP